MKFLILALLIAAASAHKHDDDLIFTEEFVKEIHSLQNTWNASLDQGSYFDKRYFTVKMGKQLCGARKGVKKLPPKEFKHIDVNALPTNFDSSVNWPNCKTILNIRDQSACGSCWAFGAAEAISDRYCTVLGASGNPNLEISSAWLMSCCAECGDGCQGGFPEAAWQYWVDNGLPTDTCDPYPFPKCEHHIPRNHYPICPHNIYPTPSCNTTCTDGSSPTMYNGKTAYSLAGQHQMMTDIHAHGPIEVAFNVYADFLTYKSGVYKHVSGALLGGHAVKAIGWGVTSSGTHYWIINNSWNADWGMKGQFWILRGVDECGIEDDAAAGLPAALPKQ
jgi:cysteine peptidase C